MTKLCSGCRQLKSLNCFRTRTVNGKTHKKDGTPYLRVYCKDCEKNYKSPPSSFAKLAANINRKGSVKISVPELRKLGLPEGQICYLCGDAITSQAELDHILPRSKGGDNRIENLAWTHRLCNRMKHDLTVEELVNQMKKALAHLT